MTEPVVEDLPDPAGRRRVSDSGRPVVLAAVLGGGVALTAVIIGLVILGWHSEGTNDVAMTGLAAIGSTLAGGFAGWIARGQASKQDDPRRSTDPQL